MPVGTIFSVKLPRKGRAGARERQRENGKAFCYFLLKLTIIKERKMYFMNG
jgi:hypothetical protein